jgi:hypothetical protein
VINFREGKNVTVAAAVFFSGAIFFETARQQLNFAKKSARNVRSLYCLREVPLFDSAKCTVIRYRGRQQAGKTGIPFSLSSDLIDNRGGCRD